MIDDVINHNIMKNGNVKVIPCKGLIISNFDVVREWIKWLSYEPLFEKEKMDKYSNTSIYDLGEEDLRFINSYNSRKKILPIIKKYSENTFTLEEGKKAYDFLTENSLSKLMLDKLTKEELIDARCKASVYSKMDYEIECCMLDKLVEKYDELSMPDSLTFRVIYEDVERKSLSRLNNNINVDGKEIDNNVRRTQVLANKKMI